MDLEINFDSSTAAAPAYLQTAASAVIAQYDALFTNPIKVTINLGWGEENGNAINSGAVADNQSSGTYMSYAGLTTAMAASAITPTQQTAVANLPSTDFTNGGKFYVPLAEQKALGIQAATSGEVDGYVGLNSSLSYSLNTNGQIASGTYDIVSVLEHEVSQVLGRISYAGQGSSTGLYTPMDLFRYSAAGQRSLTSGFGNFSVDGQNMLASFGNSGDASDWNAVVAGDVFGNVTAGLASHFSAADFALMDALGYDVNTNAISTGTSGSTAATQPIAPPNVTVHPAYNSDVSSQGGNDTFVFSRHTGDVVVSDFVASGAYHDTLNMSHTSVDSLASVLAHTQMMQGEAVIHLGPTDTIELPGVTKAQLRNLNLFSF